MWKAAGTSISPGIAIGPLRVYHRTELQSAHAPALTPSEELARFESARHRAQEQLAALYRKVRDELGEDSAAIFEIHRMLLEDEDYLEAVRGMIQRQGAAQSAVLAAGEHLAAGFAAAGDPCLQARAADLRDISRRVADLLAGETGRVLRCREPVILAADDLRPSELIQLDRPKLLGLVTRSGSPNSHTAILARAMNIPALTGVEFDGAWEGRLAVLDGEGGRIFVDPSDELLAAMEQTRRDYLAREELLQTLKGASSVTLDGRKIRLCANICGPEEAGPALQQGAEGIGLFRSEFIYLNSAGWPSEEQQFLLYRRVVEAMAGKRVVIRTLDIGADKQADYFHLDREENPALGCRGIRVCLTRREIFEPQLRAILRASAFGPVSILFPMIISLQEVRAAREILEACRSELQARGEAVGEVEVGIMVETPAAVMTADELAQEVDFFSLGTNDLTQYTLAVDRQNPKLGAFYDPCHPAVLRMIRHTVEAGHRHGCWVGLCGELGADPALTETFLRMGLDELSVPPSAVLPLRGRIRSLDLSGETAAAPAVCRP